MEIKAIRNYKKFLPHIADMIKVSGCSNTFIAQKLGMKRQDFISKKQRADWSKEEIEKLLAVIDSEEVEDYMLLQILRNRENDETISFDEYKKIIARNE